MPKFVLRDIFQVVHLTLVVPLDLSCTSLLPFAAMPQRILPALFLTIVLAARTGAETLPVIQWQDQRLSITAKNVLLADILRTVAQQTGVEVQGLERVQDIVSLQLSQVPLHTAIQHLLASLDHLLLVRTTPNGEVRPFLVLVLGRRKPTTTLLTTRRVETTLPLSLLVQRVQEQDPNQRLVALQQLDALPVTQRNALLADALQDPDPSVRQVAYKFLYEQGEKEALAEILRREAQNTDSERRKTAIETVGELFTVEATELLLQATTDDHPDIRAVAFAHLSHLDLPEAEQVLRMQLTHPTPEVRLLAIEAMAARGTRAAREAALVAMSDSDELVRGKGANVLHELEISEGGTP